MLPLLHISMVRLQLFLSRLLDSLRLLVLGLSVRLPSLSLIALSSETVHLQANLLYCFVHAT